MSEINFEELAELVEYVHGEGTYTVTYANMQGEDDRVSFSNFDPLAEPVKENDFTDENTYLVAVEVQEQAEHVAEQIDKHGEDVIRAAVRHMVGSGLVTIDPMNLERYLENNFRGEYESAGAYAKSYAEETGSDEDQAGVRKWGKYIDWNEVAKQEHDDDFIRLTGEDGETEVGKVFVFDNDPRI